MLLTAVHQQAVNRPQAPAIRQDDQVLTYGDLWRWSSAVAKQLQTEGFRVGDRLVFMVDNSPEYVVMLLATWMAGGVVVPLSHQIKSRDLLKVTGHVDSPWVFVASKANLAVKKFVGVDASSLKILDFEFLQGMEVEAALPLHDAAHDECLIIYTSGTTGDPKGVTLTHEALFTNLTSITEYLEIQADDCILSVLPFHYSYGNSVLLTHLISGAALEIGASMMFPQQVVEQLRQSHISSFSGVPTTYTLLLGKTDFANKSPQLRYVTQAGGAMAPSTADKLCVAMPNTQVIIMYGQTEASARLTWLPADQIADKRGSAGRAIPGVVLQIRDERGLPVEPGIKGEVFAQGGNLMKGYWRNPEATNRTLIDGWLKTGDMGHLDKDGYLYLQGRQSEMIKAGAHRIFPGEIEEVLLELDAVLEAAVVGVPDELMGQTIRAYVVAKGVEQNTRDLMRYCKEQLPLFKMPKDVVWVESLPKTSSGKIQKHLLS